MRVSHAWRGAAAVFDEDNLVSSAGLVPVLALAEQAGLSRLLGEHDFAAYCKQREGATTVRRLLELRWERVGDDVLEGTVRADAFCHNMVRSLVGTLLEVGRGDKDSDTIQTAIITGDRTLAGKTAPAQGLTLLKVDY